MNFGDSMLTCRKNSERVLNRERRERPAAPDGGEQHAHLRDDADDSSSVERPTASHRFIGPRRRRSTLE